MARDTQRTCNQVGASTFGGELCAIRSYRSTRAPTGMSDWQFLSEDERMGACVSLRSEACRSSTLHPGVSYDAPFGYRTVSGFVWTNRNRVLGQARHRTHGREDSRASEASGSRGRSSSVFRVSMLVCMSNLKHESESRAPCKVSLRIDL